MSAWAEVFGVAVPSMSSFFLAARPLGTLIAHSAGMATVRYRGFDIAPRSYQLAGSGCWTVDLEIRRNGRSRHFSVSEAHATQEEAEAQCIGFGRRIIDGRVKGWSVDSLRAGNRLWSPVVRLLVNPTLRTLLVLALIFGLGGFIVATRVL